MNLADLKRDSAELERVVAQGRNLTLELKKCIQADLGTHLVIVSEYQHSLVCSYYGFQLIFRIEIGYGQNNIVPTICAYTRGYGIDQPESAIGVAYQFDRLGNIDGRMTPDNFAKNFIADVFTKLTEAGTIVLQP
jgi:hypothetical protein